MRASEGYWPFKPGTLKVNCVFGLSVSFLPRHYPGWWRVQCISPTTKFIPFYCIYFLLFWCTTENLIWFICHIFKWTIWTLSNCEQTWIKVCSLIVWAVYILYLSELTHNLSCFVNSMTVGLYFATVYYRDKHLYLPSVLINMFLPLWCEKYAVPF
jgi:hypothetical protein